MSSKHSFTYLPHCLIPLLLLAALNYWNGVRSVDAALSTQAQTHLNSLAGEIDRRLRVEEVELSRLAFSNALQQLLVAKATNGTTNDAAGLPIELKSQVHSVLKGPAHCFRLAVFDQNGQALWEADRKQGDDLSIRLTDVSLKPISTSPGKKTTEFITDSTLRYSLPITGSGSPNEIGSLVADVNLSEVIGEAASVLGTREYALVVVLDPSAKIIYHPDREKEGRAVSSALPEFLPIAEQLSKGSSGVQRSNQANHSFVTAFSPLPQWNLGMAIGYDRSTLSASAHRWGIIGIILALVCGFTSALIVSQQVRKKSPGLERVEEGLTAIAKGELDRRIDLKSGDDARGIADNINMMTDRLRSQIAREEETRQFQSFVRLSAMLTHDLKNAIEALSLIVGNMERHFDNEQFRVDALKSLTGATNKLKGIVARLTRPLTSLSGEHPRPQRIDLIPILKRVTGLTAEPLREKHTLELKLPQNLFVFTDPERIEIVVENLIINALEAMADTNGKLTIEAGLTSRGAATFSITDTGPGMSQSFIENRLFRPFSTTKKHGVGLGLYTCREVIQASGGVIEVQSIEGAGTTFRVMLPSASHDSRN